ncbi:response regulator transcription factor [Actinomyces sp. HMT897]|uniref:response regulator transcription factor n=1 Tax=Actinomyces sp. HMT897 TaxID=2789424 RepID=UPI001909D4D4|nr:response regulator transcription factor [Actinomyces sp. HMT897]QQO77175.1 response regulator transcription factor [Actinomyces sp. HMT897]
MTENTGAASEKKEPVRVLLADDDEGYRRQLSSLLGTVPYIDVVAVAGDGREALNALEKCQVDVALVDIAMPSMDGVEVTKVITECYPDTKVVILSGLVPEDYIEKVLATETMGFLTKDMGVDDIARGLRAASQGQQVLGPEPTRLLVEGYRRQARFREENADFLEGVRKLPKRQRTVYDMLVLSYQNKEIAKAIGYSEESVRRDQMKIRCQLGCSSRTELLLKAARLTQY